MESLNSSVPKKYVYIVRPLGWKIFKIYASSLDVDTHREAKRLDSLVFKVECQYDARELKKKVKEDFPEEEKVPSKGHDFYMWSDSTENRLKKFGFVRHQPNLSFPSEEDIVNDKEREMIKKADELIKNLEEREKVIQLQTKFWKDMARELYTLLSSIEGFIMPPSLDVESIEISLPIVFSAMKLNDTWIKILFTLLRIHNNSQLFSIVGNFFKQKLLY